MSARETLAKIRESVSFEMPRDPRAIETLVASGLALSGLALGGLVSRRFRLLSFGACGFLAASALTGFSPLAMFLERRASANEEIPEDEEEEGASTVKVGVPAIAALGVPHRIPEEAVFQSTRKERSERPAKASGEEDLGEGD